MSNICPTCVGEPFLTYPSSRPTQFRPCRSSRPLEELEAAFLKKMEKAPENWFVGAEEKFTWYESKNRLLTISIWPAINTQSGVMAALASLVTWVEQNAFQKTGGTPPTR